MSTETKEEMSLKGIREDLLASQKNHEGEAWNCSTLTPTDFEIIFTHVPKLISQLAQLTRERDLAREGCRLGVDALGKLEKDFNILSHPGQRMIILQASNRMEALAMGKEK